MKKGGAAGEAVAGAKSADEEVNEKTADGQ